MAERVSGIARLAKVVALVGALMLSTAAGCEEDLRSLAEDLDIDLEGADEAAEHQRAERAGHHPWDGDEDDLRAWCVAWADTHQSVFKDGYFPGNVRTEDGFSVDYGNMEPHYDIVWEAFHDAYALAPAEIEEQVGQLRAIVAEEMDTLEAYGWNFYDAISDGALDMSVGAAAERSRWITPIDLMAERWCWQDPDLRGPLP
jgi:hypothetical protein